MRVGVARRCAWIPAVAAIAAVAVVGCGRFGFDSDPDPACAGAACYALTVERATWDDARAACAADGAHLVTIADADENVRAFSFANTIPIEADDFPSTNHWSIMWMDGRAGAAVTDPATWSWADTGEPMAFSAWRPGEPSGDPDERCLIMLGREDGAWDNRSCDTPFAYLCEDD